jgi:hypothetical protein
MADVASALDRRSSTFRSDTGNRTYILITSRTTSGDELPERVAGAWADEV